MGLFDKERTFRIGQRDTLGFEFYGDDLPTGVTVSSGTVAVSPATGLTLGSPTAEVPTAANGVFAWATGVAAGEYYVTFTVTFSDGKILPYIYLVVIPDPALSGANILTIEEAKQQLQSSAVVADQAIVESAIEAVSARFAKSIGVRSLRSTVYAAETLDGAGEKYLYLPAWPVTTFSSITEDGVALVENTDFYVDYEFGIIERVGCDWIDKRKAIVTTFTAGYAISGTVTLPRDLKMAALIESARMVMNIKNSLFGETSRSLEGTSISFNTDEFLPDTIATLRRYRRFGL